MPIDWIDVTNLSFNALLLLERVQLSWFPGWVPEKEMAIALHANPAVVWYLRHKCPEIVPWIDQLQTKHHISAPLSAEQTREAERKILRTINDLILYVVAPSLYDAQPFLSWNSDELRQLADFTGKIVLDIGSGTGRLALIAAETATVVYAVEPVANLRLYIKQKAQSYHFNNVYPVDGLITDIPFPPRFADITMGGHVFGDNPHAEYTEMARVTKPGGIVILCPGSSPAEKKTHDYLREQDFNWSEFEEPTEGMKRKYWKVIT
jgi:SAM-dependent methyltransferase